LYYEDTSVSESGHLHYALIPHVAEPRVLLIPTPDGWTLPPVHREEFTGWSEMESVSQAACKEWGLSATTLRCLAIQHVDDSLHFLYALEHRDARWQPPDGARWVEREMLADYPLAVPAHRAVIEEWFAWWGSDGPLRVPWYRPGWMDGAVAWLREQAERLGLTLTGAVEQVRSWQRSAILRVPTNEGYLYFKAVPPVFAHEIALTEFLARHYPAHMPHVLAVERQQQWMLMAEVCGTMVEEFDDLDTWQAFLRRYAEMQIEQAQQVGDLLALGVPERRLPHLLAEMDALLEDTEVLRPGPYGFHDAELAQMRGMATQLKDMCAELADYGLPDSLDHGDLWPQQILISNGAPVFIDWSDSSITHPFFSLSFFVDGRDFFWQHIDAGQKLARIPDVHARLVDAYLEPWEQFAPLSRLREAARLAAKLCAVHHALLYHRLILPGMELAWEMQNMLPYHLKRLLES